MIFRDMYIEFSFGELFSISKPSNVGDVLHFGRDSGNLVCADTFHNVLQSN